MVAGSAVRVSAANRAGNHESDSCLNARIFSEGPGVCVSGRTDLAGHVEQWFLASLANTTTFTQPLYVSYTLLAYDDVYDVFSRPSDVT